LPVGQRQQVVQLAGPTHQAVQATTLLQLLHVPNQDQIPTTACLLQR